MSVNGGRTRTDPPALLALAALAKSAVGGEAGMVALARDDLIETVRSPGSTSALPDAVALAVARQVLETGDVVSGRSPDGAGTRRGGGGSFLAAPVVAADGDLATVGACIVAAPAGRTWSDADVSSLTTVARAVADELVRARGQDGGMRKNHLRALRKVTAALADAVTPEDVATVVAEEAGPAMGASAAVVARLSPDGRSLDLIVHQGYDTAAIEVTDPIPLDADTPLAVAARRREAVLTTSVAQIPVAARGLIGAHHRASASVPLMSRGRLMGVLGLSYDDERAFDEDEASALASLAQTCGLALERAQLLEAERTARARAEHARDDLAFLADASLLLSASLDPEATLATLVDLIVPRLADWAGIDVFSETGAVRRLAAAHRDPERKAVFDDLHLHGSGPPEDAYDVFAFAKPVEVELTPEYFDRIARDDAHRAQLDGLGARWALAVPLRAGDRTLGVLSLAKDVGRPRFERHEIRLLSDLGGRAGAALENAHLHRASTDAVSSREEALGLLDGMLTSAPIGFVLLDADMRIVRVNEAMARATGRPVEDHVGHTIPEIVELPPEVDRDLRSVMETGQAVANRQVSTRLPGSDRVRHFHAAYYPVRSVEGDIVGTAAAVVEITERVEAEAETVALAEALRQALLPAALPRIDGVDLASAYLYGGGQAVVGGDFYDVFDLGRDNEWALVIGDVCGTGPEAANVTTVARHTIRAAAMRARRPSVILGLLNEALVRQDTERPFCTVLYAALQADASGARVTLAAGGHPLPLVLRAEGRVEEVGTSGTLLGVFGSEQVSLTDTELTLDVGDTMVIFTDGVTEAQGPTGMFGDDRLSEVLAACAGLSAREVVDAIVGALLRFANTDRHDDIAVLAVRSTGSGTAHLAGPRAAHEDLVRLDSDPASAGAARRFVEARLAAWGARDSLDVALLLTSELVGNAVRHARGPVWLRLVAGPGAIRIEVEDSAPRLPVPREAAVEDESGRGLALVDALADRWGVEQTISGGKSVWFEVDPERAGDA